MGAGEVYLQRFDVTFEYPVAFTRGLFAPENPVLLDAIRRREPAVRHRVLGVVDAGVLRAFPDLPARVAAYAARHAEALELLGAPEVVPGGEQAKNDPDALARLWARFRDLGLDRHSFVLVIGGGAVQDMVGYAAATAHRGLRVIRVPTTVLSQNDSGVGVKNAVNALGAKNFLGTFAPPFAVLCDLDFLSALPPRDLRAGMAEAVKVALIRDRGFFDWLAGAAQPLARFDPAALETLVRRCALLHLEHIATSGDPFEHGSARPLDFGHWAAHKLEMVTDHALRHGEAVAIGMALDSRYAVEIGLLGADALAAILSLLEALGLPLWHDALGGAGILDGLDEFREHLGGELCITLLEDLGRGIEVRTVDREAMRRAIAWLRGRGSAG